MSEDSHDFSESVEYVKAELNTLEGWKHYKDVKGGNVKGYQKPFKDGFTIYRGVGYLKDVELGTIVNLLMSQDHEVRRIFDNNPPLLEFKMRKVFSDKSQIAYLKYKSPTRLVYDRDCVAIRNLVEDGDVIYNPIIDCEPDFPTQKRCVRCKILVYCWVIVNEKDKKRFRIEYFSSINLGGWIPKWVINSTSAAQPENLHLFIEEAKKLSQTKDT